MMVDMDGIKNIILITIDSLRYDYSNKIFSDNSDFMIFNNAFSSGPYTINAMMSLFTGYLPSKLKTIDFIELEGVYISSEDTLPSILQEQNYLTIGVHSNPFLSEILNFDKGFDIFYDYMPLKGIKLPRQMKVVLNKALRIIRTHPYLTAKATNNKIKNIIESVDLTKSIFLWVHYMDTHGPYQRKKGFVYWNKYKGELLWWKAIKQPSKLSNKEKEELLSSYKEEIAYLSNNINLLFNYFKKIGIYDESLIILTADHGDSFGEHGYYSHPHKLYDELLHVPFGIKIPGYQKKKINTSVNTIDILPTILDVCNIKNDNELDGKSLMPLINGIKEKNERSIVSIADNPPDYIASIRKNDWKLIIDCINGEKELYNIKKDPCEKNNVVNENNRKVNDLEKELKSFLKPRTKYDKDKKELDIETKSRLKDLGYL